MQNERIEMWVWDANADFTGPWGPHYKSRFMTEYNVPDERIFYYAAEYPFGYPDSTVEYLWIWALKDSVIQSNLCPRRGSSF